MTDPDELVNDVVMIDEGLSLTQLKEELMQLKHQVCRLGKAVTVDAFDYVKSLQGRTFRSQNDEWVCEFIERFLECLKTFLNRAYDNVNIITSDMDMRIIDDYDYYADKGEISCKLRIDTDVVKIIMLCCFSVRHDDGPIKWCELCIDKVYKNRK